MKNRKRILILVMSAILVFGNLAVFAETAPSVEKRDRFKLQESSTNDAKKDTFSMISSDGALVINIGESTPISFEDGTEARPRLEKGQTLQELLNNRELVVTYSIVLESMPPQTSPEKVMILFEKPMPVLPPVVLNELSGEIVVNGEKIKASAPYLDGTVIMVPLRAIAEKIGFDVNWDKATKGVRLGSAINLWIDKDNYTVGKMAPIKLGTTPALKNGQTYVPLSFFQAVITGYKAYESEGTVIIEKFSGEADVAN